MKITHILFLTTMNTQLLKDKITIVIPSKNESRTLYDCVYNISKQKGISKTRVIIADISDKEESLQWVKRTQLDFEYNLNIEVIEGGYPAYGRYIGGNMVTTPYVLFLDADVMIYDKTIILDTLNKTKHLTTVNFTTDHGFNWIYSMFFLLQKLMKLFGSSFAVGGFQLFRTDVYRYTGGYNPTHMFAEDYYVSNKIWSKLFTLHRTNGVYTSSRRFKNKGIFHMIFLMMKCWLNRNDPEFYKKSHGYWN